MGLLGRVRDMSYPMGKAIQQAVGTPSITRAEMETIAVNALMKDKQWFPTEPDRITLHRRYVRAVLDALDKAGAL